MAMNETYRDAIATHGGSLITHIGLVDDGGDELNGGSPAYARKAVTWTTADDGQIDLDDDLVFDVPSGATVGGWQGYSAGAGGTAYGIVNLTNEEFANQGTYTLLADGTHIAHDVA